MRDFCEYHSHKPSKNPGLYHTVVVLKSSQIDKFIVHKGKDPSVELWCFGEAKLTLNIMFTGDMERQKFVNSLINLHDRAGKDSDKEDEAQSASSSSSSDDEEKATDSESEEDMIDPVWYD